jgi:Delta3-Delta2-enoyl-CoA isomerase
MLLTLTHGPIRELRLNRPPANALSYELIKGLREAIEAAPQNGVRALILSGTPGRFSGGLDVPLLLTYDRAGMAALWREFYALLKAMAGSPIPIAAAITGHAPAGGTVLSLFCDWRVMADGDFKLGLNEVQIGLPLPPVIFAGLRRLVNPRRAPGGARFAAFAARGAHRRSHRRSCSARSGNQSSASVVRIAARSSRRSHGDHPPPSPRRSGGLF